MILSQRESARSEGPFAATPSQRTGMLNTGDAPGVSGSPTADTDAARRGDQTRWAFWAFVVYLVGALPLLLWMGSYRWFLGDEWSFLSDRSVTIDGLFRPHNQQHWVTIPVLVYRGLYSLVGLHHYWPYQLVVIVLHLTTAALLRVVMRRAGVGPWLATVAAASFVLLGSAEDNILWAFQITFVGALVFGLTQIILADHDGPIDRRDWIGLGAGLVALMMSGQAPSLVVGAGLVCVFRRRWTAALLHTVPLAIVYLAWARLEHVTIVYRVAGHPFSLSAYAKWMKDAATGLFVGLGSFVPIAIALAVLLVAGVVLAWRREGSTPFLRRAAVPAALVVVAVLTMTTAAPSRFYLGSEPARAGRYIGVMAALTLPALAVAADVVTRRWSRSLPFVCLLFLVPLPFNAVQFGDNPVLTPAYFRNERGYVSALAEQPLAVAVPPWVEPNVTLLGQPDMTIGWLLGAAREGKLPPAEPLDAYQHALLPIQLGVAATSAAAPGELTCARYDRPLALDPSVGEHWLFKTPAQVAGRAGAAPSTLWVLFSLPVLSPESGQHVEITLPDLHLLVAPVAGEDEFELCR